jgi:acyl transferase domain-containing protein/NAD(P)H-dependent flavin oxidoreductase YrpB (nitropropane dioxygenase family)/NAD(P)-dependent dehydrogenase (short-subunit alcohol dehydrogenase family)
VGAARAAIGRLLRFGRSGGGVKLDPTNEPLIEALLPDLPAAIHTIMLAAGEPSAVERAVNRIRLPGRAIWLEATTSTAPELAWRLGLAGLIAKGNEAGGIVHDNTAFILMQRLCREGALPVLVQGGIGPQTVAACRLVGAVGAILDSQLILAREANLPFAAASLVAIFDGSETIELGIEPGSSVRLFAYPHSQSLLALRQSLQELIGRTPDGGTISEIRQEIRKHFAITTVDTPPLLGQDAAFAQLLAERFRTVAGIIDSLRGALDNNVAAVAAARPLSVEAPLALAHGTLYPIVQGPMTRVSDSPTFARAVAEAGALPFIALAMMRREEATSLLAETTRVLGDLPWGVGVLGFVPEDLRREQLAAVRDAAPTCALVAGGHPDQAIELEQAGVPTYLHVPSPALLRDYVAQGARRFVFEGRECGGHVGPRSSFILWQLMVDALIGTLPAEAWTECHILLAGGIHDARSAAMAMLIAGPLLARGAKVGVLVGTAYLFTEEAVATGAIEPEFQNQALACTRTALLTSGVGHTTRCATSAFVSVFEHEKRRLVAAGLTHEEVRDSLERLNIGRLRIASKALVRRDDALRRVNVAEQRAEGMFMMGQVSVLRDTTCTMTALHENISVGGTALLSTAHQTTTPVPTAARGIDIAIIGMSCILPGSPDLESYWANILAKYDAVTEIPENRWDWRRYYAEDRRAPDRIYGRWGGFIEEISFDPLSYGMPPNSLTSIEPIQLLALEAVRAALDHSGYAVRPFPRERTAVIFGAGGGIAELGNGYCVRAALPMLLGDVPDNILQRLPEWTEDTFPGILLNVIAGRVANRFDLNGPNYTVDAACASSLAAVAQAVQELRAGVADMAIVGGAEAVQSPFAYLAFSKTQALSPRGRCRSFDCSADGIVISEGIAVVVLKRLADAERDGDRIHAVIKGIGTSSDGRDRSLTAPRPHGQTLALRRAYAAAELSPATIGLIEAHGTGTPAGDDAELVALAEVYQEASAPPRSVALGSVKSMIGHTKATAGLAGLIKAALALDRKVLPPTLHVEMPNERARAHDCPFYVNTQTRPWLANPSGEARRAAVSAFGFGGTNYHAVLEAYEGEFLNEKRKTTAQWQHELILIGAPSVPELRAELERIAVRLACTPEPRLRDLAFTLASNRRPGSTLAIVASSIADLRHKIETATMALAKGIAVTDRLSALYWTPDPLPTDVALAFLFPGQGSQYPGMMAELAVHFQEVRAVFECAEVALAAKLPRRLGDYLFPPPSFGPAEEMERQQALTDTRVAQPALGAAGIAALRLFAAVGVSPSQVAGHSYGEYVALCASGAMDETTLFRLSAARGRVMAEAAGPDGGGMAAVAAPPDRVATFLEGVPNVWLANLNAPTQTVLSGTIEGLEAARERLALHDLPMRPIPVACAFHSPIVAGAAACFAEELAATSFVAPKLPVFANATADCYPPTADGVVAALSAHMTQQVRFQDQILAMYDAGARIFVEAGPRNLLTGLVGAILGKRQHVAVALDIPGCSGLVQFLHALAQLASHGVPIDPLPLFAGRDARRLDLNAAQRTNTYDATWLVNAARAHPRTSTQKRPMTESEQTIPARPTLDGTPPTAALPAPPTHPIKLPPIGVTVSSANHQEIVLQFQALMGRFLDTQQQVMLAYLRGDAVVAGPAASPSSVAGLAASPSSELSTTLAQPPAPPLSVDPTSARLVPATESTSSFDLKQRLGVPAQDVRSELLSVVSELTGYPTEMLGLDLSLEADLGIDSIKRAEIFATLRRIIRPGEATPDRSLVERLAKAKSLRAIAAIFETGDESLPLTSTQLTPLPSPIAVPPRFILRQCLAPLASTKPVLGSREVVLLTDDGNGLADQLANAIQGLGAQAGVLRSPAQGPVDPITVMPMLRQFVEEHGTPTSIVHLRPMAARDSEPVSALVGEATNIRLLFTLAHSLSSVFTTPDERRQRIVAVLPSEVGVESTGAHGGFLKSLALEWPHIHARALNLPVDKLVVSRVLSELCTMSSDIEINFTEGQRHARRAMPADFEHAAPNLSLGQNDVVVLTGGARGITSAIARALAQRFRCRLVLVGRSPLPAPHEEKDTADVPSGASLKAVLLDRARRSGNTVVIAEIEAAHRNICHAREIRQTLAAIRAVGGDADYIQADVLDQEQFSRTFTTVRQRYGRIDGVVLGAGVIEDSLLADKAQDSFDRVYNTKINPACVLAKHLVAQPPKFVAFLCSVAGSFGNLGQSDYAAANAALNRFASALDHFCPSRLVAINWGPWEGAGMAEAVGRTLRQRGFSLIEPSAGASRFIDEILLGRKGEVEVVIGSGPWETDDRLADTLAAE